jgi:hypothetical protein
MQGTETMDATATVASKISIAGSVGSVASWASASDFGMWAGIVIGIAGLLVNWYYKRQSNLRAQESHRAFMAKLETTTGLTPLQIREEMNAEQ